MPTGAVPPTAQAGLRIQTGPAIPGAPSPGFGRPSPTYIPMPAGPVSAMNWCMMLKC